MFASGAHIEHDTKCTGLFGLCSIRRLTPLARWKVDVTQLAVKKTRQCNTLLLNADFQMPL